MVTIIIPCRHIDEAKKCIEKCLELDYPIFEVIVLPDTYDYTAQFKTGKHVFLIVLPTGPILPSRKRDRGILEANGDIVAFIDADAYPTSEWLYMATSVLEKDKDLGGVCGPGLLPPGSGHRERAADGILRLLPYSYRVFYRNEMYVDDYPTFNLLMRKECVKAVGGFACGYLTGEDTRLCDKIINDLGKKIMYSPLIRVFHQRRKLFLPFLKQMATYGRHRGYFFKRHPATSRRLIYVLPSLGLICGTLLLLLLALRWLY